MNAQGIVDAVRDEHQRKTLPTLADVRAAAKGFSDALNAQHELEQSPRPTRLTPDAEKIRGTRMCDARQAVANASAKLFKMLRRLESAGTPIMELSRDDDDELLKIAFPGRYK